MSWKSIISGWQGSLILMVCAGILITGCAGSKHEIVKFNPAQKESFSARKQGPQISHRTKEELIQSGYIKIGNLNVEHTVKECWDDSSKCDPVSQSKDPTTVLLNTAADKGADVVLLSADKKTWGKSISKKGKCIRSEKQCVYVSVPITETECDYKRITCNTRVTGSRSEQQCSNVCIELKTISGKASLVKSSGTLWRHDPELAKKKQQQLKRKLKRKLKKKQQQLAFNAALKAQNLQKIQEILAGGRIANVNTRDSKGNTALYYAVEKGNKDTVLLLLDKGAHMNQENWNKETVFQKAIIDRNKEMVSLLLDKGFNMDQKKDVYKKSAFEKVVIDGNKEMVSLLLDKGVTDRTFGAKGRTTRGTSRLRDGLFVAIEYKKKEMVLLLLDKGAPVNKEPYMRGYPIYTAVGTGDKEIVSLLFERGADVNVRSRGDTPLHYATKWGKTEIMTLLLERGADINAREDSYGNTPLHQAVRHGRPESIKFLLDKGADPNIKNKRGEGPLFLTTKCPPSARDLYPKFARGCKKCDKKSICREMGELLRAMDNFIGKCEENETK